MPRTEDVPSVRARGSWEVARAQSQGQMPLVGEKGSSKSRAKKNPEQKRC